MEKFGVLFMLMGICGCAVLNQAIVEVDPLRLTSQNHPEVVDGNLETVSTFPVMGQFEKGYEIYQGELRYATSLLGSFRTDIVIKLDVPMYISYIEVYPASRIPRFALVTTLEDPPRFATSFEVVAGKQHRNIENGGPVKVQINREMLYLRMTADGMRDEKGSVRVADEQNPFGSRHKERVKHQKTRIQTPLKGASIREVKFYTYEKF